VPFTSGPAPESWPLKMSTAPLFTCFLSFFFRHAVTVDARYARKFACEKLRVDRDVMLHAVSQNGFTLLLGAEAARGDREVVLAAVKQAGGALEFAAATLQDDKEVVLAAVAQDGLALDHASLSLCDDDEVVCAALTQNGRALEFASERLCDARAVVMVAVAEDGYALEFASEKLQADRELVLRALKEDGGALEFADYGLCGELGVVLRAVASDGRALQWASPSWRSELPALCASQLVQHAAFDVFLQATLRNPANSDVAACGNASAVVNVTLKRRVATADAAGPWALSLGEVTGAALKRHIGEYVGVVDLELGVEVEPRRALMRMAHSQLQGLSPRVAAGLFLGGRNGVAEEDDEASCFTSSESESSDDEYDEDDEEDLIQGELSGYLKANSAAELPPDVRRRMGI